MKNRRSHKPQFTTATATLISRILTIAFLALFLQACELDDGTDSYDDEETIVYTTDDGTETIDNDDTYELLLKADGAYLILEDDLSTITVQGDGNYLVIDSDTNIEEIDITGDENIIVADDDVNLTIDLLNIIGNGNSVTAYEITTYNQTSDADDSENLACEVSGNGFCL